MAELLRSCLFVLWNVQILSEAWFSDSKNITCLQYHLWIMSSSPSVQTFVLWVKWGLQSWSWTGPRGADPRVKWGLQSWRWWEPRGWCWCYYSRAGVSLPEMHKHKVLSEGSPQLRSWTYSCSIGDELFGGSCPIEDEPLELRDMYLYCDSRVGAFLLRIQTKWQ